MTERRRGAIIDAAATAALALVSVVGFTSWYSRTLFDRAAFEDQYRSGVYRGRVVGRELVLWVERVIGDPFAELVPPSARDSLPGDLFSAMVVVNLVAFVGFAVLLRHLVGQADLDEVRRALVFVSLLAIVALSTYVVTPYDLLGLCLLLGFVVAARARPPLDLAAPVLAVVGVANRESQFVALAGLVALWWVAARGDRRLRAIAVASGVAAVVTYVGLRLADSGGDASVWAAFTLEGNLGRATGWVGLAVGAALVAWWWSVCSLVGLGVGPRATAVRRAFWLLASPYVVVAALSGYWFEVRLLVPLLVVECWTRIATPSAPDFD